MSSTGHLLSAGLALLFLLLPPCRVFAGGKPVTVPGGGVVVPGGAVAYPNAAPLVPGVPGSTVTGPIPRPSVGLLGVAGATGMIPGQPTPTEQEYSFAMASDTKVTKVVKRDGGLYLNSGKFSDVEVGQKLTVTVKNRGMLTGTVVRIDADQKQLTLKVATLAGQGVSTTEMVVTSVRILADDAGRLARQAVPAPSSPSPQPASETERENATTVSALNAGLTDPNSETRQQAADSLARLGTSAVPALSEALRHKDKAVRLLAAQTLGKMAADARGATLILTKTLKDEDAEVQAAAREALAAIHPEKSNLTAALP
jgi:hypothetical protein